MYDTPRNTAENTVPLDLEIPTKCTRNFNKRIKPVQLGTPVFVILISPAKHLIKETRDYCFDTCTSVTDSKISPRNTWNINHSES